jgi:long-subunit acyl-CoA synthetase (AMP-forming)
VLLRARARAAAPAAAPRGACSASSRAARARRGWSCAVQVLTRVHAFAHSRAAPLSHTAQDAFATGLAALTQLPKGTPVVIYAETKTDWMARARAPTPPHTPPHTHPPAFSKPRTRARALTHARALPPFPPQVAAQAVYRQNCTVVTIYATLGQDGVKHGVNQTRAPIVIADVKLLPCITSIAPDCPHVTHLITIGGDPSPEQRAKLPSSVSVHAMDAVVAAGGAPGVATVAPVPPQPSDVAVIMYTSGTTGAPKGVVIPHSAVCASMAGLKDAGRFTCADVYLAYLPLAHIMEMAAECVMFAIGCAVGYGSPQTLTDSGLKLAPGCRGDAPTLRPTFMVFAPTVLDRVRSAVQAKIAKASPLSQSLFAAALAAGGREFDAGRIGAPPLWNALVFKKVQALIGGRVSVMISGSAPLSLDTQRFVQTCFNCPLRQGYGLTETCSAGTVGAYSDNGWSAGRVLTCCKLKLLDWEEGNYRVSDEALEGVRMPRGEVLIGGPVVSTGYYQNAEAPDEELAAKNASDFSVDPVDGTRYFHTGAYARCCCGGCARVALTRARVCVDCSPARARAGDIGQVTPDGQLQIIDRKKDLVKLQMGEYVALSKVENAMKQSSLVDNALCYALSTKSAVVALVVPAAAPLRAWGDANGLAGAEWSALCASPAAAAAVLASVQAACKKCKLIAFEIPVALALVDDPWTPENDCTTAAMKLKRQVITKVHAAQLAAIYK